jgi:hypothetical protein
MVTHFLENSTENMLRTIYKIYRIYFCKGIIPRQLCTWNKTFVITRVTLWTISSTIDLTQTAMFSGVKILTQGF